MEIQLKCFATLSEGDTCDFADSRTYEISDGETVRDLVTRLGLPVNEIKTVFVNHKIAALDSALHPGDRLALAPPVGGM